tara:strand:- start:94 stop:762 length:669 start_codon:yes stop_codon:yes gene_type:complete
MIYLNSQDLSQTRLEDFNQCYIIDDLFSVKILSEIEEALMNSHWSPCNIAHRHGYPDGVFQNGRERLMGTVYYHQDLNKVRQNKFLMNGNRWGQIDKMMEVNAFILSTMSTLFDRKTLLKDLVANLQFHGMDGCFHTDGPSTQHVVIWMIGSKADGDFIMKENEEHISYKNGRIISFPAPWEHRGSQPSVPHQPRFTVKTVIEYIHPEGLHSQTKDDKLLRQ